MTRTYTLDRPQHTASRLIIDCARLAPEGEISPLIHWVTSYPRRPSLHVEVRGQDLTLRRRVQRQLQILGCTVTSRHAVVC